MGGARWVAAELRLKSVTLMLVECYMVSGIGLTGENLIILGQLQMLTKMTGLPTIIAGDWQAEPHELAGTGWPQQVDMEIIAPEVHATCASGKGRLLDYFVVTKGLLGAAHKPGFVPWHRDEVECEVSVP